MSRATAAPIILLLLISFGAGFYLMQRTQVQQSIIDVCDLIEEKFYLNEEALHKWAEQCRKSARRVSIFSTRAEKTKILQDQMDQMHVSHFLIYSPAEDERLWKGQAVETGLKGRWMEDHMVIYQIVPDSPAARAGFKIGDEILSIDGEEVDADIIITRGGRYRILRSGKETLELQLTPGTIHVDSKPQLQKLDERTALLTLSSFRSEYFEDREWKKNVQTWLHYPKLIIDLRENAGGNIVSMLRALSPFFCEEKVIGSLALPRREDAQELVMANDLSDDEQIEAVEAASTVRLQSFPGYGCYRGSTAVLVGPHTSSVSEMFASAMLRRPYSRVMGQPTAGDVVLAVWYDLPNWGRGFSISIPEALFVTPEGKPLEGQGVYPQQEVFDDLNIWRRGQDSWIRAARMANF